LQACSAVRWKPSAQYIQAVAPADVHAAPNTGVPFGQTQTFRAASVQPRRAVIKVERKVIVEARSSAKSRPQRLYQLSWRHWLIHRVAGTLQL
jgi:hypothetical protein